MKIKNLKLKPTEPKIVFLQALLMPNGEIIHQGKTIGFYRDLKNYLYVI